MDFPSFDEFEHYPFGSGYARQVSEEIVRLLELFKDHVPDSDSNSKVTELARSSEYWLAAHAYFDVVRDRYLQAKDRVKKAQYFFEEVCTQTIYNATDPVDPFDSICPFWVMPAAIDLAKALDIPLEDVVNT